MRILVISSHFPPVVKGGYERECEAVVDHLRRRHEVRVLTSSHARRSAEPRPDVRRVLPLLPGDWRGSLLAPLLTRRSARLTAEAVREFDPHLIYYWNGARLSLAVMVAASRSRRPIAFRVCEHWLGGIAAYDQFARHLTPGDRGLRLAWAKLIRLLNRDPLLRLDSPESHPASISWNSSFLRHATTVPASIDPLFEEVIHPATPQGDLFAGIDRRPSVRPTILFVGRVTREKGIHVAYRALAHLRGALAYDASLIVAGPIEAGLEAELRDRAVALKIGPNVEIRGELGPDGIAALLETAHALVVPSVWEEPAGLVCVEAALARLPIVASRSGGIPELVRDRRDGLLFSRGDAEQCAELLAETLADTEATRRRVDCAFERAQQCTFQPYVEATDRFLERTMRAFGASA
jgi:glycosyltransferase involved in cell wall biosynthesis